MISLCKNFDEFDFLPADAFSARITALADTYGFNHDFALFWVQRIEGVPVAAVSKVDGNITLCCTESTDYEELGAFLDAVGYSSITSESGVLSALKIEAAKESFIVRYSDKSADCEEAFDSFDLKEIYNLLCSCGFEMGDYSAFLADVCARLNKGTAEYAVHSENGGLLACAFKLFCGRKSVLLGAVATDEKSRGRGLASKLVTSLAASEKEKEVFLFCRNDSLLNFYSKIGFELYGWWAVAEK